MEKTPNKIIPQKKGSHMEWSWIIIVSFFILSILDIRFGILGFVCMITPMALAASGQGKIHCSHYCPRGSFLGKVIKAISFNNNMPKFMDTKLFKNILLALMISMFSFALYHAGLNFNKIAFSVFRFMGASFMVGILMGIIFKPRSWCKVCPMGYASGLIGRKTSKKAYTAPPKKAA